MNGLASRPGRSIERPQTDNNHVKCVTGVRQVRSRRSRQLSLLQYLLFATKIESLYHIDILLLLLIPKSHLDLQLQPRFDHIKSRSIYPSREDLASVFSLSCKLLKELNGLPYVTQHGETLYSR
jgi:hypothetical protein